MFPRGTATDRGSDFVAAEHILVYKVFITNVNNSADLNKVTSWSKSDYIHQSY